MTRVVPIPFGSQNLSQTRSSNHLQSLITSESTAVPQLGMLQLCVLRYLANSRTCTEGVKSTTSGQELGQRTWLVTSDYHHQNRQNVVCPGSRNNRHPRYEASRPRTTCNVSLTPLMHRSASGRFRRASGDAAEGLAQETDRRRTHPAARRSREMRRAHHSRRR